MRFNLGAKVYTADGEEVGKVDRLVVDPRTDTVNEFVVRRGLLTQHDVIIPTSEIRDRIGNDDDHQLHLALTAARVRALPQFEESAYVVPPVGLFSGGYGGVNAGDATDSTGIGLFSGGGVLWPGSTYNAAPPSAVGTELNADAAASMEADAAGIAQDPMERSRPDDVFIGTGTDVKAGEKKLGTVHELVVDAQSGKVTELIVKRGLLGGKELRIPTQFIESVGSDAIYVSLNESRIEEFTVDA